MYITHTHAPRMSLHHQPSLQPRPPSPSPSPGGRSASRVASAARSGSCFIKQHLLDQDAP
ncbi:hypothetical protein E2C01_094089 [Portunus trituberculatus]|uniref:Uncharacterized protein n=1 Tax=Portunus trituberculatus TaxID=210409 RepID=A0A5B7K0N3_PORTR|nr:hypothetical protein [Portunus trituberculatus]